MTKYHGILFKLIKTVISGREFGQVLLSNIIGLNKDFRTHLIDGECYLPEVFAFLFDDIELLLFSVEELLEMRERRT